MRFPAYERARSVREALTLLAEGGEDARAISGGQSLVPMMNLGLATPEFLIDVSQIPELQEIRLEPAHLSIGAAVTHTQLTRDPLILEHAPIIARAARHIGSQRIRNRGTIGGSVSHGDAAAELPLAAHVAGAEYKVATPHGHQWRAAREFSLGHYQTNLRVGELLTAIRIPLHSARGWGFHEYARRTGDFALTAAAAAAECGAGTITHLTLAATGLADRPVRLSDIEDRLTGAATTAAVGLLSGFSADLELPDDPYCAGADRARLVEAMAVRAVRDAVDEAERKAHG